MAVLVEAIDGGLKVVRGGSSSRTSQRARGNHRSEVVVVQVEVKDERNLRPPYIYTNATRDARDVTSEAL